MKNYGGWTRFMQSMGLKPWETRDAEEGKTILEGFVAMDEEKDEPNSAQT